MTRIALYSHDALGLGHLRRNLAIAEAFAAGRPCSILLISGARQATLFEAPPGVDYLTLPAVRKSADGGYAPRSLGISGARMTALRAQSIRSALEAFEPHALVVDKHPRGLGGELEPALGALAEAGGTRFVLGLRDVLDEPRRARSEWVAAGGDEAVRHFYDQIWIYGDPRVYDLLGDGVLGEDAARKARYTGYLGRSRSAGGPVPASERPSGPARELPDGPLVVALAGGGEDGFELLRAFGRAVLPAQHTGVIVTGPFMAARDRRRLRAAAGERIRVLDFVRETAPLLHRAGKVVAMGGYNTVCELLSRDKDVLLVPRAGPRAEQLIRADRLRRRGLVDVLPPEALRPEALTTWLGQPARPRPPAADLVDLQGLGRLPGMLSTILGEAPAGDCLSGAAA